jgi:hypothetical protein
VAAVRKNLKRTRSVFFLTGAFLSGCYVVTPFFGAGGLCGRTDRILQLKTRTVVHMHSYVTNCFSLSQAQRRCRYPAVKDFLDKEATNFPALKHKVLYIADLGSSPEMCLSARTHTCPPPLGQHTPGLDPVLRMTTDTGVVEDFRSVVVCPTSDI